MNDTTDQTAGAIYTKHSSNKTKTNAPLLVFSRCSAGIDPPTGLLIDVVYVELFNLVR
eukprot:COSAG06_NODE_39170_length_415_cov_1.306962_1_plen_57_part_10